MSGRSLWDEFKTFAFKGNMIDLAVAFVVGAAFSSVVKSMVDNIFMPIIGYIPFTKEGGYLAWHIGTVKIGVFLGALINFLLIAIVVFIFVVKLMQLMVRKHDEPAPAPTTRDCPYCLSSIPIKATRCAHCTADVPPVDAPVAAPASA